MLSLTKGKPIAKSTPESKKKIFLSIYDKDYHPNYNSKKQRKKNCCKYHDEYDCEDEPCCDKCNIYYETDSEEDYSSEDDEIGKVYHVPKGCKLVALPDVLNRFVFYIAGPAGSGKSYMAANIAKEYHKVFPKRPIYMFSRTKASEDPAYRGIKLIQIVINELLIEDPIDITEEIEPGGALMIFDDCGTIHNDKIKREIEKLMTDSMEISRKMDVSLIITNHLVLPNEKKFARTVMNELNTLTVFPKSGSAQGIRYALKTYFGLTTKQIDDIISLDSRWVQISKGYPQYVLYDKGAYIL